MGLYDNTIRQGFSTIHKPENPCLCSFQRQEWEEGNNVIGTVMLLPGRQAFLHLPLSVAGSAVKTSAEFPMLPKTNCYCHPLLVSAWQPRSGLLLKFFNVWRHGDPCSSLHRAPHNFQWLSQAGVSIKTQSMAQLFQ